MVKELVRGGTYGKNDLESLEYVGSFSNLRIYRVPDSDVRVFAEPVSEEKLKITHILEHLEQNGKIQFYARLDTETGKPELPSYV